MHALLSLTRGRKMKDEFLGSPIVNIPQKTQEIDELLLLQPEEAVIYRYALPEPATCSNSYLTNLDPWRESSARI